MLFEASNQFWIALSFIWLGLLVGCFFEVCYFEIKNKIISFIFDIIFWGISVFFFFVWVTNYANADFRIYCVICFVLGFLLEQIFWHKFVANFKKKIYNVISNKFRIYFDLRKKKKLEKIEKKKSIKELKKKHKLDKLNNKKGKSRKNLKKTKTKGEKNDRKKT